MKLKLQSLPGIRSVILSLLLVNCPLNLHAAALSISFQPKDQTLILYQPAAFGVIASGTAPLFYQWGKDGMPIRGATNDQLVFAHAQFSDAGIYSVIVSNAEGRVTSADARLTVSLPKGGDLDYSFAVGSSINGAVRSLAVQPNGKVLIAGDFWSVYGAARAQIARLNSDGTTDYTFMGEFAGVNGTAWSVAVQSDGKVLVGAGGVTRLNPDGSLDNGFQNGLSGVSGLIYSIAVQGDGKAVIRREFTAVNGTVKGSVPSFDNSRRHWIALES
jgi:hypothetical protein